jgi:hypothetical protein
VIGIAGARWGNHCFMDSTSVQVRKTRSGGAEKVRRMCRFIRQWQFQPNVVQGKPTWSRMRALVRFSADGTTAVAFAPPLLADSFGDPGARRDELREAATPPIVPEAR